MVAATCQSHSRTGRFHGFPDYSRGKEWSCFNGAVRAYWPFRSDTQEPKAHPLWTLERLRFGTIDDAYASSRIRRQLRRQVLGISAFSVTEPNLIRDICAQSRREELNRLIKEQSDAAQWQALANTYADDNDKLTDRIDEQSNQIQELQAKVFSGTERGKALESILWHPDRNLPLVVISTYEGSSRADAQGRPSTRERCRGCAPWRTTMTVNDMMMLRALLEKSSDADLLRDDRLHGRAADGRAG